MASIFELFGELGLKSDKLEAGLKRADAALKSTDAQLDKVISTSNKLGDTSATVARRYEKLGEGIAANRARLKESAEAFLKGDTNAKQFGSTIASVEKQVGSLNSRLKDAAARTTEISDTGFTHFQNQIKGAVSGAAGGSNDLFGRLSTHQKANLSYQVNDIITGLASGQSPFQILAQQGGQIFQIFQQGVAPAAATAASAVTTAAATTEAAAAESAFAASATTAASATAATAASTEATAASTTILGASLGAIATIAAVGAAAIVTTYLVTTRIREEAERRLALEGRINQEILKQVEAAKELQTELAKQRGGQIFQNFLQDADNPALAAQRVALDKDFKVNERRLRTLAYQQEAVPPELGILESAALVSQFGVGSPGRYNAFRAEAQAKEENRLKAIAEVNERQSVVTSQIKDIERQYGENNYKSAKDNAAAYIKVAEDAAKIEAALAKKQDAFALDHITKLTELNKFHYKSQAKDALEAFDQEASIAKKREELVKQAIADAKQYASEVKAANQKILESQKQVIAGFQSQVNNRLSAVGLRQEARQFQAGKLDDAADAALFQNKVQERINAAQRTPDFLHQFWRPGTGKYGLGDYDYKAIDKIGGITRALELNEESKAARNRGIIAATQGIDPSRLTAGQNRLAANARFEEADRLDKQKDETLQALKDAVTQLEILNNNGGLKLVIDNQAPDKAKVTTRPRQGATNDYYQR